MIMIWVCHLIILAPFLQCLIYTSTATAVPLFTASDIPSAGVVGTLFATSNRSSVSACNSVVTDVHDCPC